MNNKAFLLFDKLHLREWYKFLLYVGVILLVLGIVFGTRLTDADIIGFSLWTIPLMIVLWIYDDVTYSFVKVRNRPIFIKSRRVLHLIFLLIWIFATLLTLL